MKYFPSFSPLFPFLHSDPSPMKHRTVLSAALSASALLLLSAPAGATTTLFNETFASNTGDWSSSSGGASFDNAGWNCTSTCKSQSAIKMGTGSASGTATSPLISLPSGWSKASVTVSFQAAAWYGTKNCTTTLSVIENNLTAANDSWSVSPIAENKSDALKIADLSSFTADSTRKDYKLVFETRGSFQLLFETSGTEKRIYLDSVVVVAEEIVSGPTPLSAPDNLSLSNVGYTGFSLSWNPVSDATDYRVTVLPVGGTVSVNGTTASVTGLTPGETYAAYVVALGNGTTSDDSAPAELTDISTLASVVLPSPTNLHTTNIEFYEASVAWDPVNNAEGYTVTVSPSSGVTVSDNGTTADLSGLEEGATYTVSVVAKGTGIETVDSTAATLDVTTAVAPAIVAPELSAASVSASSVTIQWPAQASASFSVRAWTLVPTDVVTEDFVEYAQTKTVPDGWIFENTLDPFDTSSYTHNPVDFKASGNWIATPEFGGVVSSVTFRFRSTAKFTGSFTVYGTTGSADRSDWVSIRSWETTEQNISVSTQTLSDLEGHGFKRLIFAFEKTAGAGNIAFGSFSVTGTGVGKQPSYLTGYGPDATAVAGTSVTISNPVAGETNYIEVTATGLSGKTATATRSVAVPAAPRKPVLISIQ